MSLGTPRSVRTNRLQAAGLHLLGSLLAVSCLSALVLLFWYPAPYWRSSGGLNLLVLIAGVDVVLGPLVTLVIYNTRKPLRELRMDIMLVVLLQVAGLGYGLWSAYQARPLFNVFEYRLFRVVHAADIPEQLLGPKAGAAAVSIPGPLERPALLALRNFQDNQEQIEATAQALEGLPLSARPDFWRPYSSVLDTVRAVARPLQSLADTGEVHVQRINELTERTGKTADSFGYVPMVDRVGNWVVVVDMQTAQPTDYWALKE